MPEKWIWILSLHSNQLCDPSLTLHSQFPHLPDGAITWEFNTFNEKKYVKQPSGGLRVSLRVVALFFCCFVLLIFVFAMPHGIWDQTHAPCTGSVVSKPLDHQGGPAMFFYSRCVSSTWSSVWYVTCCIKYLLNKWSRGETWLDEKEHCCVYGWDPLRSPASSCPRSPRAG